MPLIKNPFKSKIVPNASNTQTSTIEDPLTPPPTVSSTSESPRLAAMIKKAPEPDYKLSSVTPEGTFMPPSPPEKTSFMSRFKSSGTTSSARSLTPKDAETGFVIPRESFEGYRRSFDIRPSMDGSGMISDGRPSRSSLDLLSATMSASPRRPSQGRIMPLSSATAVGNGRKENVLAPPLSKEPLEDEFEDVKLDEEVAGTKKKRFWSRSMPGVTKKQVEDENELRTIKQDVPQQLTEMQDNGISTTKDTAAAQSTIVETPTIVRQDNLVHVSQNPAQPASTTTEQV